MPTELSPIKSKRMEEKASLQQLNSRLEMYVLGVNELEGAKHAAEKELETIKQRMQQDLESVRLRLTKELEETRKKLDDEMDQNARLQTLEQEQYKELVKLRAQQTELGNAKVLAETLRVQLEKEKADATSAKETLSEQTTQLNVASRRVKELERELRGLLALLNDAKQELEELRKKSTDFDLTRDAELSKLRREWAAKHLEAQAQWKKDTEDRLQSMEMEVRSHFESVSSSLQNQLDDVQTELDSTKKELDRTATDYEESLKARQALTEKVAQLEREYREVRSKATRDRKAYEETLERFRSSKVAKEREFNELMDVKIALDAEIMKYRRILDREESRVAASTPNTKGRKRKNESTNDVTMKRTKRTSIETEPLSSAVHIASLDLEKDRIVLKNTSHEPIALGGWVVRGQMDQTFRFPATYVMRPHSTLTVHSSKRNKNAKHERKKGEDSFLANKFSLNPKGDFVVLLTSEDIPVSFKSEGLPEEEVRAIEDDLRADFLDDEAPPFGNCGMM
ncbi:lamin-l-like isoform x1 [Plasmopara halstedii]|uniref:Lamin-l-like isoform x1 n=1 Tax=Plasmopara halstedii TaxID=4781 RepID=A0A0P1B2X2_PLAHL|nr:lamin-l-like isoform x1 [Plasmopara halstedii]CEG48270.1 lamin-l-like isoform x1 [Plasmopara halstedii]|eukprot:XP_024584639.1 lamin-l-like isoform x1 [Plasmopara halstedii]